MSVHVETAGLASTPASRFCIAGIGSGQLRSSVGGRRRSPYVDSGAPAVDIGGEPGDTYRRTTAQDGQSADECYVVVISDRRYLSRRCRIPQTAHQLVLHVCAERFLLLANRESPDDACNTVMTTKRQRHVVISCEVLPF